MVSHAHVTFWGMYLPGMDLHRLDAHALSALYLTQQNGTVPTPAPNVLAFQAPRA